MLRPDYGVDGAADYSGDKAYSYSYSSRKPQSEDKGRTSFIPPNDSPGPAAYAPTTDPIKQAAPRTAFGTANRDNEAGRYISELHNKSLPAIDTPGPGTYRTAHEGPQPHAPTWKFGTAEQRVDPEKSDQAQVPGPIYSPALPALGPAVQFAPMGSLALGRQRSRYDDRRMFLSADHSRMDRGGMEEEYCMVGPGGYDVLSAEEKLSAMRRAPSAVFGTSRREAGKSLTEEQIRHDPSASSAAEVPGAIYEYKSQLTDVATHFTKAPQVYKPEKGSSTAGPYLSRGHEIAMRGTQGPGPGCYDVQGGRGKAVSGLGDAPQFPFGVLPNSGENGGLRRVNVPGPGAYNPKEEKTSAVPCAPGYSMAANLRTNWADLSPKGIPGPGSYNVAEAARIEAKAKRSPAFTLGSQDKSGRSSFIPASCTPGPQYDCTEGNISGTGPGTARRGYSFGARDKTRDKRLTVGVRYLGPLAANEALGTASPGPVYNTIDGMKHISSMKSAPQLTMASSKRTAGSKIFISRQHAEAEGMGADSPGPGAYDHNHKELAEVTSRFRKSSSAAFSTTSRFKNNYSTF